MSETSQVTKPIVDALNQMGHFAMRLNAGKVRIGRRYLQLLPAGTADILCFTRQGTVLWLETKKAGNRTNREQIEAQGAFKSKVEAFGHTYARVESLDDALTALHLRP